MFCYTSATWVETFVILLSNHQNILQKKIKVLDMEEVLNCLCVFSLSEISITSKALINDCFRLQWPCTTVQSLHFLTLLIELSAPFILTSYLVHRLQRSTYWFMLPIYSTCPFIADNGPHFRFWPRIENTPSFHIYWHQNDA